MSRASHRRPGRTSNRCRPVDGPIRGDVAGKDGWTLSALRHAVASGDLERVSRNVYDGVPTVDPDATERRRAELANLRRARAAVLTCERAAISHVSSAIGYGIPTIGAVDPACVTVQSGTALRDLAQVHLHRATIMDGDLVDVDGYPQLPPARTVLDVARERGVPAGVVAADYALHTGLVSSDDLALAMSQCMRWPGRKAARITTAFADGRGESPLESLSRLEIASAGLPPPRPQAKICDERGTLLGRGDFYWDEFGVIGESDGDLKYEEGKVAIVKERGREKSFWGTGLIVVRWGWSDLRRFAEVSERLRWAFAHGERPGSPCRRWSAPPPGLHP